MRRTVLPSGLRIAHRGDPDDAQRLVRRLGRRRLPRRDARARPASRTSWSTCSSRAPSKRTALDISAQIEAVGGETNAFTTKEYTCYYARVLDADLPLAVDVMCDAVADSVLDPADVETERGVILEEIAMHDDEPGDEVHDLFAEAIYGDHPLGRLISGTEETISPMTRQQINGFYRRRYTRAVASWSPRPATSTTPRWSGWSARRCAGTPLDARRRPRRRRRAPRDRRVPRARGAARSVRTKDTEQAHLVLGGAGIGRLDERRFALGVLNNVLGGGMSSRLFQEIREKRGLAYSVYSYASAVRRHRPVRRSTPAARPGKVDEVLDLTRAELAAVAARRRHRRRSWPAARAWSRARTCSAWRTPARG